MKKIIKRVLNIMSKVGSNAFLPTGCFPLNAYEPKH